MKRILLIDDNECYIKIGRLVLNRVLENTNVEVVAFTDPKEGLTYILSEYELAPVETIIFLDINMPVLNGWDILNVLDRLPDGIKKYFTVYLLSSSIDPRDKRKALMNAIVKDYLEKPLSNHLGIIRNYLLHRHYV